MALIVVLFLFSPTIRWSLQYVAQSVAAAAIVYTHFILYFLSQTSSPFRKDGVAMFKSFDFCASDHILLCTGSVSV